MTQIKDLSGFAIKLTRHMVAALRRLKIVAPSAEKTGYSPSKNGHSA
ncbi:hypothetical protein ACS8E9_12770 [Pseudomonas neustonica]|nr:MULTISPECIES: hypothetical protein [Pseudomonas]MBA6419885.1 hypothetical protein [Pseudomonas sp. 5Ae-yellow]|tara:strand:+ start:6534 stop:6674 length:141 start_codon:yes stop_codon:yes gene_type:complete